MFCPSSALNSKNLPVLSALNTSPLDLKWQFGKQPFLQSASERRNQRKIVNR